MSELRIGHDITNLTSSALLISALFSRLCVCVWCGGGEVDVFKFVCVCVCDWVGNIMHRCLCVFQRPMHDKIGRCLDVTSKQPQ
mmetsp:Transcript_20190/g.52565  ORF Transcript_20190/g.52565 Transcript_20190/m.52565 type:complete len:84 (+) Transcript_20190:939-1190(+)